MPDGEVDYGYLLDDDADGRCPTRARGASPTACTGCPARSTPRRSRGPDGAWTGRQLAGAVDLRAARRHVHARGHARRRDRQARPPARARRRLRRADAGQRRSTAPTTGATTACCWFAVHEPYGGPAAYQRFVDACHAAGLGVIQDVVYNHLGPSGQLPAAVRAVPQDAARNTWGDLVNLDGDGLRRGAPLHPRQRRGCGCATTTSTGCGSTPCTRSSTTREPHLLEEMAIEVAALSAHLGRPLTLIAESDLNDPRLITPARGRRLRARRAVERRLPPRRARRADRRDRRLLRRLRAARRRWPRSASAASSTTAPTRRSAAATTAGPIDTARDADLAAGGLQPEPRPDRQPGRAATGSPSTLDDDQLALRRAADADRAVHADAVHGRGVGARRRRSSSSPRTPSPSSGEATAEGRIAEFERMGWDPAVVPDPQDPATFARSKLDWSELERPRGTRGCSRPTGGWPRCAATIPDLTDPAFAAGSLHRRRGAPGCSGCGAATLSWSWSTSATSRRTSRCPASCCSPPATSSTCRSPTGSACPRTQGSCSVG